MTAPGTPSEPSAPSLPRLLARIAAGLIALLLGIAALAHAFHGELEAIGRGFVERFGVTGMVLGTFIADGFHFHIPRGYIYAAMAFAALVEVFNVLAHRNRTRPRKRK